MKRVVSIFGLVVVHVLGCSSSSDSSSGSSSTTNDGGGATNGGESSNGFACASETCDATASYCSYVPSGDQLVADRCKPLPTGCKPLRVDESCAPDEARCGNIDPTQCIPADCKASTACDCIAKSSDCPQSGTMATKCSADGNRLSFACYVP